MTGIANQTNHINELRNRNCMKRHQGKGALERIFIADNTLVDINYQYQLANSMSLAEAFLLKA